MRLNTADFFRKAQFPLLIALGILPLPVWILLHNAPDFLPALALLIPAALAAAWVCILLPGKVRLFGGFSCCAGLCVLSLRTLPILSSAVIAGNALRVEPSLLCALVPLLLCTFLLYSLQFAAWPREREIAFNWYAACVIVHLIAQLMCRAARIQRTYAWDKVMPVLTACFVLFLMLTLLSMNRTTMQGASLGRQYIPPSMRRRNVAITLSLLLGALVIAGIPAIVRAFERLFMLLLGAAGAVMAFIARLLETDSAPGMGGSGSGMGMMPPVEYTEPGLLAVILEKIAMAAALILAAVIVLFILYKTFRLIQTLIRRIAQHLSRYMAAASQDYVDEITNTREESGEASSSLLDRLKRIVPIRERHLSPAERIRYRYRLLLRRHPDWPLSRTARESLTPEAAALYEAARYDGRQVTEEDAEQFKKDLPM